MSEKSNASFQFTIYLVTIFLTILVVVTVIIFSSLTLNINHTTIAQQQLLPFNEDISFDIDNVAFSHHMASVNGIQMHYVVGGKGEPIILLHGWPET